MKPLSLAIALAAASTFVVLSPKPAHACGACFSPPDTPTVVSGHRMVMSISEQQTVLWDQIQYQGEPEDFASCANFGAAVPVWKRLTPPGGTMRAAPLIALGAALTLLLRRVLRGKRWARATA